MTLEVWIAFCATEAVLCLIPGPAVLVVASMALARGFRPALGAALGVLAANTLYFALSAAGVGALLLASRDLFLAIKWLGAAYLIWMGARMVFGTAAPAESVESGTGRPILRGFVVQGANPKAIVFFSALLPQFIDPSGAVATQLLVLGASSVVIELLTLTAYALTAVRARQFA